MKHAEYLKYYNREDYLFDDVSKRFRRDKDLTAFDFFCIIIWKANRAKSTVAKSLLKIGREQGYKTLDAVVKALTGDIHKESEAKKRLEVLMGKWKLKLPMASAVLTVLYPEEFTIYDVRVCKELKNFESTKNQKPFDKLWESYEEYIKCVKSTVGENLSLRDKDRWLFGRSFAEQLEKDIENKFPRPSDKSKSEE